MCCEDTSLHTADGDAFLDIFFINFEEAVRVCVCGGGGYVAFFCKLFHKVGIQIHRKPLRITYTIRVLC